MNIPIKKLNDETILAKNTWLKDVKIVEESVSTQIDAKSDGQADTLYIAERQTGTYGRFGRNFFASPEGGIYMTLLLKQKFNLENQPNYTLLAGAAVVSAIEKLTDKKPLIKWVNDIYLNNKKIVGILAEAQSLPDQIMQIAIGIGINFYITDFPDELAAKAGSLFDQTPTITRTELIAEIWSEFKRLADGDFFEIYKSHSLVLGKTVEFHQNGIDYSGLATDLTENGELIVLLDNGDQKIISSGEISLKKWT